MWIPLALWDFGGKPSYCLTQLTQSGSRDYTDYALNSGIITLCDDGSYILETDQGNVHLNPETAQALLADGFRMEINQTLEVPYP